MSKRDPFYKELFPEGQVRWPDGAAGDDAAGKLFGAVMVACVDRYIASGKRLLRAEPWEHETPEQTTLRSSLKDLSDEQKQAVTDLIEHVAKGVFYGMCVKIDQFPGADVEISLIEESGKGHTVVSPQEPELGSRYFEWMEAFGDE